MLMMPATIDARIKGMIIILSSRMNMSPTILMCPALSPNSSPTTTPPAMAINI
jgi:hypothetical protein